MSFTANVDAHHVIPDNYILKKYGEDSKEFDFSDTILNKVRINKISNIKIGDKAPSIYLNEILNKSNPNISNSLKSHGIKNVDLLLNGTYDEDFFGFLKSRYNSFEPILIKLKIASEKLSEGDFDNIWE